MELSEVTFWISVISLVVGSVSLVMTICLAWEDLVEPLTAFVTLVIIGSSCGLLLLWGFQHLEERQHHLADYRLFEQQVMIDLRQEWSIPVDIAAPVDAERAEYEFWFSFAGVAARR